MSGLVPGIHVFSSASKAWMAGTSPAMTNERLNIGGNVLAHLDRDIGRIGHDVVDGRTLLRLRHERFDIFALGVGIDLVGDVNATEAVADVAVDTQDALDVHVAFDRR